MMDKGTETSDRAHNGLLHWLGFGRSDTLAQAHAPHSDALTQTRERLLQRIGRFLLDNELEITPENLTAAHSAFAGLNPGLRRRIARRVEAGEKVTQQWLDQATASDGPSDEKAIEKLTHELERGIDQFSRSTQTARNATSSYGEALAEHVEAMDTVTDAGDAIATLADYARAMLDRSRKAEAELRKAETEAEDLRKNLARARRDAEVDFLTGLPNRRSFEALLETEYLAAQNGVEPLCVAFCDIDNFKLVNDTHGHDAGDRVIRSVAKLLAKLSDEKCHVARHGGEEFVLLLRGSSAADAVTMLDTARKQMAARRLVNRRTNEPFGQITFSGGVADVFAFETPRDALGAADAALYEAKESGRNRVVLAQADG